jgi:hypothetical protein
MLSEDNLIVWGGTSHWPMSQNVRALDGMIGFLYHETPIRSAEVGEAVSKLEHCLHDSERADAGHPAVIQENGEWSWQRIGDLSR